MSEKVFKFFPAFLIILISTIAVSALEYYAFRAFSKSLWGENIFTLGRFFLILFILLLTKKISYRKITFKKNHPLIFFILPFISVGIFFIIYYTIHSVELIRHGYSTFLTLKKVNYISTIVVIPIFEEIIYRGLILTSFLSIYSVNRSILFSAILFSLLHFISAFNPYILFSTFCGGLLLGWLFTRTNNLLVPIITHICYNAIVIFYPQIHLSIKSSHVVSVPELIIMFILGIFLLLISLWMIRKKAGRSLFKKHLQIESQSS